MEKEKNKRRSKNGRGPPVPYQGLPAYLEHTDENGGPSHRNPLRKQKRGPPTAFGSRRLSDIIVVREEARHREKKGGSQVTARAGERERRRYSM